MAVTNEIHALCRLHLLSWSNNYVTCLADVSSLLSSGTAQDHSQISPHKLTAVTVVSTVRIEMTSIV